MALMPGGGYAELAAVDSGSAMKIPASMSDEEGAAFPEVFLTAFLNIFMLAEAQARRLGAGARRRQRRRHGVDPAVQGGRGALDRDRGQRRQVRAVPQARRRRRDQLQVGPFPPAVKTATNGRGADVILDSIGAAYLGPNLEALAHGGRLVLIGLMMGTRTEIDLAAVLRRHLEVIGSTLRTRPEKEKAQIVAALLARFGAALEAGRLRPPIYKVVPMANVAEAHRMMAASEHFGKIVLRIAYDCSRCLPRQCSGNGSIF